jgi:hypothetical protein
VNNSNSTIADYLDHGVVMLHPLVADGIDQPPPRLVAIHQHLAGDVAVREGDDTRIAVEFCINDKTWCQLLHGAEVADDGPDRVGRGVDGDVAVK